MQQIYLNYSNRQSLNTIKVINLCLIKELMKYNLYLKDRVTIYLMYVFCLSIPLGQKMSTITLLIWLFLSIILVKPSQIIINKKLLLLPALYFVYIASLIYTENFNFKHFEQKASLIAFPILFYLNSYKYSVKVINKTLLYFVIG